jgi:phage recombination protein Bet
VNAIAQIEQPGVIASMADRYGMNAQAFESTLRATIMPKDCSKEQVAAFLLVAKQHDLNPFTKEIFAFPSRGGIQPIVSVDGWMKLINSHPQFDGMQFDDHFGGDGERLTAITCKMFRKDRSHPVEVTEYMAECYRDTETWKRWPARMLRHKAAIQAARYAFGFAGIMEPDEVERMVEAEVNDGIPSALEISDDRKARCDAAAEQYAISIDFIKMNLAEATSAAEAGEVENAQSYMIEVSKEWHKLPNAAKMDLWLAPTKGGIFTTAERAALQRLPRAPDEALEVV